MWLKCPTNLSDAGLNDDAFVLKKIKKEPGDVATKLRHFIENPKLYEQDEPLSPAEALALLLDVGLSEQDYIKLSNAINKTRRILPPIYRVRAEKAKCRPDGISPPSDVDIQV